jgi:DNA-binding NarL/FixJ family response regulator
MRPRLINDMMLSKGSEKEGEWRTMIQDNTSVLIVARPGPLREGLGALMSAIPQIDRIDEVDGASLALTRAREQRLAVVLLGTYSLGDEIWRTLRQIKAQWPKVRCVVLAENDQQQREAQAAGADAVFLNGFPAARLVSTIESLLIWGRENDVQTNFGSP